MAGNGGEGKGRIWSTSDFTLKGLILGLGAQFAHL